MYLYVNILIQPNAYTRVFGLEGYCLLKQLTPLAVVEILLALEHATIFSTKLGISRAWWAGEQNHMSQLLPSFLKIVMLTTYGQHLTLPFNRFPHLLIVLN